MTIASGFNLFDCRSGTAFVLISGNLPSVLFLVFLRCVLFLTRRTRRTVRLLVVVTTAWVRGKLLLWPPPSIPARPPSIMGGLAEIEGGGQSESFLRTQTVVTTTNDPTAPRVLLVKNRTHLRTTRNIHQVG